MKIIAMIPARIGSERLKYKNLRLLNGKPVISYAINAAKSCNVFDKIVVNSDETVFEKIANRFEVDFYLRPKSLGSSTTQSDEVVFDFLNNYECDLLVWVNPIAPLQTGNEITNVVDFMIKNKFDSVITCKTEKFHTIFNEKPLNFNIQEKFAKTQDLKPIKSLVYSLMMWKSKVFFSTFNKFGHAMLCGKPGFFEVEKKSTIKLNFEEDFQFCEAYLQLQNNNSKKYDELLNIYLTKNKIF